MAANSPTSKLPKMAPGQRYGRLTSLAFASRKNKQTKWLFRCDCGKEHVALASNVRAGYTQSCGCGELETQRMNLERTRTKHGKARTPEYRVWIAMNRRCGDPSRPDYPRYGGRGIKVCEHWRSSFEKFLADMGPRPSPSHSLERKKNSEGYSKENCVWATAKPQARNRQTNRLVIYQGQEMALAEACERAGVDYDLTYSRIRSGWSLERALTPTTPTI